MSVFDLDQKGQQALAEDARLNPLDASQVEPTAFTGTAKGAGMGVMKGGARVGQFIGLAGAVIPMAADKLTAGDNFSGKSLTDRYFEGLDETVNRAADYWTPGHADVGKAGQILGGLSEIILPMLAGGGNPAATAAMVAGSQTAGTGIDLSKQGVDGKTAGTVAAIQGLSAYAGFKLPFLGSTLAARMGSGAAGNLVTNAGGAAIQSKVLEGAGYADQAKQFDPLNLEARAVDVLAGMVFGGFAHWAAGRSSRPAMPSDTDAVLTASNAKHFQADTAPGMPADATASAVHQSALEQAIEQLARGERVSVADSITEAEFVRPAPASAETPIAAAVREAYGETLPAYRPLPPSNSPRGVRNNNPGNIERSAIAWQGEVAGNDPRFATFETPEAGVRALAKNLIAYHDRHGLNTVDGIINRWAPPGENRTSSYAQAVARELGVKPGDPIDVRDPAILNRLTTAIIRHENGSQPYPAATIQTGVEAALSGTPLQRAPATFAAQGRTGTAVTERGTTIPTQFVAVEAPSLITSHDNALRANPDFPPDLQPRDRGRAASEAQIAKIENAVNPELLAESPKASDGAPLIGADSVVESGNARTIALRRAYEGGKADAYRQWLIDNAERFGLDPAQVAKMTQPVLARVGLGQYDRAEFARQANESAVAHMSVTETARADAARLPDLMGLVANDDGTLNLAQSAPFVRAFLSRVVSPSEHGAMIDASGNLSQQGLQRIRNAVFSKAYGDADLVAMLAESTDANVKNILAGMLRAAPAVARLKELSEAGARLPMDFTGDLVQAVRQFSQLRREGATVQQMLAQSGLFDGGPSPLLKNLLLGLEENAKAPKRVAEMIGRAVDSIDRLGDPRQGTMFGDLPTPAAPEIVARAIESVREDFDVKSAGDLFKSPEVEAARQVMERNPDLRVVLDDGTEVSVREALTRAADDARQADNDVKAFDAAVTCYLRTL